jgi:predicted DNA-binding transcriptional regulator YafY
VKPIKLIFVDNNWYLGYVTTEEILKLARVTFIESVRYATKNSYQKSSIVKHLQNLELNLQNSMTLLSVDKKLATIKATPAIAKYFKQDMKKFLSSQTFQKELEDGSVEFTLTYTNELEIMPFIQKWLPDLIIIEPQELKEHYKQKLHQTLYNLD